MSGNDNSNFNADRARAGICLRCKRKTIKPFKHIITDITDPEIRKKLVDKIRECIQIMKENIDLTTSTITSACVLEAHPKMGPPLMELSDAGIVLPRVISPPNAIEVLESAATYLGKRGPIGETPGLCMGDQFVQQVNGLREVFHRPQSLLSKKLEKMKHDLHHPAPRNINDKDTSDSK